MTRAIASATSTSDERNALSDILTKASAKRSECESNASDFVALDLLLLVAAAPSNSSPIGTFSAVATICSRLAPTRFLPFSYF